MSIKKRKLAIVKMLHGNYPVFGQTIVSINNFLLSLIGLNYLGNGEFRIWFYFSAIYFFLQSILRSSFLEIYVIGKISIQYVQKSIFLITLCTNIVMIAFFTQLNVSSQESTIIVLTLNVLVYLDYRRYRMIRTKTQLLIAADSIWLITTIVMLLFKNQDIYSLNEVLMQFYVVGSLLSLVVIHVSDFGRQTTKSIHAFKDTTLRVMKKNLSLTLLQSNLVVYVINIALLTTVQITYADELLLDIRKIIWITSPVSTFSLLIWTHRVTTFESYRIAKVKYGKILAEFGALFCFNSAITLIFCLIFLNVEMRFNLVFAIIIFILMLTLTQILMPISMDFRRYDSTVGIWISSVMGPMASLAFLYFLGPSITIITYNFVNLLSVCVAGILMFSVRKRIQTRALSQHFQNTDK